MTAWWRSQDSCDYLCNPLNLLRNLRNLWISSFSFLHRLRKDYRMSVNVLIPTPLRKLTNEQESVSATGATIGQVIDDLERQFPGFGARLTDDSGNLRRFVNIYLNEEDIRFLAGKETPVKEGDSVSIVPAIAGG